MRSNMRIVRNRDEVTLIAENGGRALTWLLLIEIVVIGGLIYQLASVLPDPDILILPIVAGVALSVWTISHVRPDFRISVHRGERLARVVRISPITGARTEATFPIEEVESLALMQTWEPAPGRKGWSEYVVALQLRGGERHVVSERGPLRAYHTSVEKFAANAGLDTRIVRAPLV